MPRVTFGMHTALPPDRVLNLLTDFSERRPELWPTLAPELYEVYQIGQTSADIKEGNLRPISMWERDHYDWSVPGQVRWTVQESNYCTPGSYVEVTVQPATGGGSSLKVEWNRTGISLRGKALFALVVLSRGAPIRRTFQHGFDKALQAATGSGI